MRILGIESSCDETAAAVVESPLRVRSNVVASQIADHQPFGGVVPELAAREHVKALPAVLSAAVAEAGVGWEDLDAVAVTRGPGLSSSLLSGLTAGWALASRLGIPCLPVHHMEGHLLSLFFSLPEPVVEEVCPALVLLVTGGHTALMRMEAPGRYEVLGRSIDDAAGEALDKGARLLDLPYPGGPEIEALAASASGEGPAFPRGLPEGDGAEKRGGAFPFSFSGLKTALRYHLQSDPGADRGVVARAYQAAVMETLVRRVEQALASRSDWKRIACVGGVAKNRKLRGDLEALADRSGVPLVTVPMAYCTDNAAMIAAVPLLRTVEPLTAPVAADPNLPLLNLRLR